MRDLGLVMFLLLTSVVAFAQTEGARISGRVTDPADAVIVGAECKITNLETNISTTTTTNEDGIYVIPELRPATYQLTIKKEGFRTVVLPNLKLYVQDAVNENFKLALGSVSESATVVDTPLLQRDSAAVSTVVDQQFVANMPLNGRSFQSLITLTPGVVSISQDSGLGQFSVNGQRTDANYFMVDGVSANFGATPGFFIGQTTGGTTPGLTSTGGTNGLVSVDAMQEFRIQTSSYAPEFGRGPGAQISIVTKSGANRFHGTAFDYLRNDIFDARNWFNTPPTPKPPLRQNDFGGTLGGRIIEDRTFFFFFSYEGLRSRQPQIATDLFYTASARAAAAPAYQPLINALPLPTTAPADPTCDNITNPCVAPITVAYSNPFSLDATSIRIDHNLTGKITVFARYNHAPSRSGTRFWEEVTHNEANTDTVTAGATILFTPTVMNDFRANWSRNTGSDTTTLTNFHGAVVPPTSVLFPPPYSPANGQALVFFPDGNGNMEVRDIPNAVNVQRQLNFVDMFAWTVGAHLLKFGIDYRRMNPSVPASTRWGVFPSAFTSIVAGTADVGFLSASDPLALKMSNYSVLGQDTWKTTNRLTLTYGLRWEINTPPASASSGQALYAVQGIFDSNPLSVVPGALWHTRFGNFAPRFGAAYQITPKTVARGGFGLFYDLGYGGVGSSLGVFPYVRPSLTFDVPFDVTSAPFRPPPFSTSIAAAAAAGASFNAFDPNLQLPFTMQWNAAIEWVLGAKQTLTVTYVGSDGRRLLRGDNIVPSEFANGGHVFATRNAGYSHYNALQVQFQRRMSRGLQALVSYNLARSSDLGSSDSGSSTGLNTITTASISEIVLPPLTPSDFDVRHSISGAISYEIPAPPWGRIGNAILKGWAVDGLLRATSVPPLNIQIGGISSALGFHVTQPDIVPGQPYWIADPTEPGGKALNPNAFARPTTEITGNFPRNGLRNIYSLDQTDLALRRRFNLTERVKLDVRVEYFNVFNHPMFGAPGAISGPVTSWGFGPTALPIFGKVFPGATTNVAVGGVSGLTTGQSALYAVGGPRSGQFTLKLTF